MEQQAKTQDEQAFKQDSAQTDTVQEEAAPEATYEEAAETTEEAGAEAPDSQELVKLQQEKEEISQRLVRLQADYDNFRRRSRLEKEDFAKYASSRLLEQLLPVIDNFGRAVAASGENGDYESLYKGVDMIYRQFEQVLEQEGLQAIEAVGQPFNPEFHQAIMQVESEEHEEGIVMEEVQKGYKLKDKVLRPAMVKVSS